MDYQREAEGTTVTVIWGSRRNDNDPLDIFALTETIFDQTNRVRRERNSNPAKIERAMKQGHYLVRLAREGRLQELDCAVTRCRPGEVLAWFGVCMFKEACLNNRLEMIRFMIDRGFDVGFHAVSEAVHWLMVGGREETDGIEVIPTLDYLVKEAGMSVNVQRKVDFYTPLHVAVERGLFEAARRLVELGADINAIAKNDAMPLSLALAGHGINGRGSVLVPAASSASSSSSSSSSSTIIISRPGGHLLATQGGRRVSSEERLPPDHGVEEGTTKPARGGGGGDDSVDFLSSHRRATSRARIAGLLVKEGARSTWRRTPNELSITMVDANNARSTTLPQNGEDGDGGDDDGGGDDGDGTGCKILCNFRG